MSDRQAAQAGLLSALLVTTICFGILIAQGFTDINPRPSSLQPGLAPSPSSASSGQSHAITEIRSVAVGSTSAY